MNNSTAFCMGSVFGVVAGSLMAWQFAKKRYEKIAQEEIDSVKETFGKRPPVNVEEPHEDRTADISRYHNILEENGYGNQEEAAMKDTDDRPYVITPDQFGELEDYMRISLTYFLDGFLADDDYDLVEDVDSVIGLTSLNHFGEYEDDSVFVRNDRLKCDYEILLDQRNYWDVREKMPH